MRQLSGALDTNRALKIRVKEVGKRERGLRREIKGVEGERAGVQAERAGFERVVKRGELEAALRRIAEVARRGWEEEEEEGQKGGRGVGDEGNE